MFEMLRDSREGRGRCGWCVRVFVWECVIYLRVAVGDLVVALVCLHGQLEVARLAREASLMPYLHTITYTNKLYDLFNATKTSTYPD